MNSGLVRVLWAEDKPRRPSALRKWLTNRGCRLQVASTFQEVASLLARTDFDLVLCQYALPDRTAFPLFDWLEGSRSSLVFAGRPGKRARWLMVIDRGERRLNGAPLGQSELLTVLEKNIRVSRLQHGHGKERGEEQAGGSSETSGYRNSHADLDSRCDAMEGEVPRAGR